MQIKRVRMIVKGHVQGVFFRSNTKRFAEGLGLKGFVRNTSDGNVVVVVEGDSKKINMLIEFCRTGSSAAKVEDIDVKFEAPKNEFRDFEVR